MSECWTQDEWRPVAEVVEERPGWLARLMTPQPSGRPPRAAFTLAGLGAVAFVLSLVLGWQIVVVGEVSERNDGGAESTTETQTIVSGIGGIDTLGLVYLLGVIALLTAAAAMAARPDLAARHRWAVGGGTVGLLGLLIAITVRLPQSVWPMERTYGIFFNGNDPALAEDRFDISYGPGLFAGYLAVALPALAIWYAGRGLPTTPVAALPAATPGTATGEGAAPVRGPYVPEPPEAASPNGGQPVDPPSAYRPPASSGPRDLTVTPG